MTVTTTATTMLDVQQQSSEAAPLQVRCLEPPLGMAKGQLSALSLEASVVSLSIRRFETTTTGAGKQRHLHGEVLPFESMKRFEPRI
jgi:hypothetical protein